MEKRSVASVFFLTLITFGIYGLIWEVKTKGEMNKLGAQIPTAWLLIVPIANIYWMWKYCEGVEHVTKGKMSAVIALLVLWLLGLIGMMILQNEFNQLGGQTAPASGSPSPDAPPAPPAEAPTAKSD